MLSQSEHFKAEEKEKTEDSSLLSIPKNQIDIEFDQLVEFLEGRDFSQIREAVIRNLNHFNATNGGVYRSSINYYNEYKLWGTYFPEKGDYALAENRAHAFSDHLDDFKWLYESLADYRSKRILVNILYYWLMSDPKKIEQIHDRTFNQYFDLDIVQCSKEEVFLDIGGYIGDTLIQYAKTFGKNCHKTIYCYEIVAANIENIKTNIELFELENVIIRKKGASSKNGTMYLSTDEVSSICQLSGDGTFAIPIVKIDDDIEEEVTFIKMDIEGGEEEALLGCIDTIKKNHPKLALSVYHNHKDMWKLARIIYEADPTYRFYIRYYGSPILPTEYLIYAI